MLTNANLRPDVSYEVGEVEFGRPGLHVFIVRRMRESLRLVLFIGPSQSHMNLSRHASGSEEYPDSDTLAGGKCTWQIKEKESKRTASFTSIGSESRVFGPVPRPILEQFIEPLRVHLLKLGFDQAEVTLDIFPMPDSSVEWEKWSFLESE